MIHTDDSVKRNHHVALMRGELAAAFPGIEVQSYVYGHDQVFIVRSADPPRLHRLTVTSEVLEDSRPDEEIVQAVQKAIPTLPEDGGFVMLATDPETGGIRSDLSEVTPG